MEIPIISNILFSGKQNIPWKDVENYLKKYICAAVVISEYKDKIIIASDFPDEYTASKYTKSLRGAAAKAKANAVQALKPIIASAANRRWVENKKNRHEKDAPCGWFRYDVSFGIVVHGSGEDGARVNVYNAVLIVRIRPEGLFLYDMINIKKEASKPLESK